MESKKETAVDWLYEEIKHIIPINYLDKFQKAKEMEKKQILSARLDGFKSSGEGYNGEYPFEYEPDEYISEKISNEQYYNETYKND
jgi:hypothetical protein